VSQAESTQTESATALFLHSQLILATFEIKETTRDRRTNGQTVAASAGGKEILDQEDPTLVLRARHAPSGPDRLDLVNELLLNPIIC